MPNHRTLTLSSKTIRLGKFILLMFYLSPGHAVADPDLTIIPIASSMLTSEDALLTAQPSSVATFDTGRRPYSNNSIWNTRIDNGFYSIPLTLHPQSDSIVTFMAETTAYTNAAGDTAACKNLPSSAKIRFAKSYVAPIHIADSTNPALLAYVKGEPDSKSPIYNQWDSNRDFWLDTGKTTPLYKIVNGVQTKLWGEPQSDGHIAVVDPNIAVNASNTELFDPPADTQYGKVWEMSHYRSFYGTFCLPGKKCSWGNESYSGGTVERATVSTYTLWSLAGKGYGDLPTSAPYAGTGIATYWQHFGGRGSGMSVLGGSLRLAEFKNQTIGHALAFTFPMNRKAIYNNDERELFVYPPATRSDGQFLKTDLPSGDLSTQSYNVAFCQTLNKVANPYGSANPAPYPLEGMRLRLKNSYVHPHKTANGTVARARMNNLINALKNYGMFLADDGGPMALEIELLATEPATATALPSNANANAWLTQSGVDVYAEIAQIPISAFEVLDYDLQASNPNTGNTAPITGKPYMMSDNLGNAQPCCWKTYLNP